MQGVAWGAAEAALRLEGEVPQRVVTAHEHVSRERRFSTLSDCGDKNTVFFHCRLRHEVRELFI